MKTGKDLVQVIDELTVTGLVEGIELLKEKFNLSDMALAPQVAAPVAASAVAAPVEEEKTEFSVLLTGFGEGKKLPVVKLIKTIAGVSLIDAKKIVEEVGNTPYEVKSGVPKAEADDVKKQLEEAGGTVQVK